MLEHEELKRYNRQIILTELGVDGQKKLKAAKVLVIGAGGLGCPVLQYLVAAGVGSIAIVDDDIVDISNLHRQILYSTVDIGKPKATIAKQKLELLNPFVVITAFWERVTVENAGTLIDMYDLIIDGSDNFPTRYLINDTCVKLDKPLVFGSIFKFEGQVSVFNYKGGPNYRDIFPEPPNEDEVPNCSEIGVIGVLPGIIGTYMANEAVKIICGLGETLSGKLLTVNALDNSTGIFNFSGQNEVISTSETIKTNVTGTTNEIDMETLTEWLINSPDLVYLVDVRENYEFDDYNIGGVNISIYELIENVADLPTGKKLIFICQTGQRSKMAMQMLYPIYKGEIYSVKNGLI